MGNSFFKARLLTIELTSLCNLKCTYCSVSHPDYRGQNSPLTETDIIELSEQLTCKNIQLHLHGESTVRNDWAELCRSLTSKGFEISLLSNLSKHFTDFEISVLAELDLWVSIDTVENDRFKKIRRGSELGEVLTNMLRINAYRRKLNIQRQYKWNSVLCQETISKLPQLIEVASELNVRFISFCNLTEIKGLEGATSIWKVPDQIPGVLEKLKNIVQLLEHYKIGYEFQGLPELRELQTLSIRSLDRNTTGVAARRSHPFQITQAISYPQELKPGQTRLCLDPWSRAVVHADLGVALCERMPPVTKLSGRDLKRAVLCDEAEHYRLGLLSESIPEACRSCSKRPAVERYQLLESLNYYKNNAC
jgi:hypothetical protein